MEYEDRPREIDRRISDALAPDPATIRSVLERSFKAAPARQVGRWRRRLAVTCAATLSVAAAAMWLHQPGAPKPTVTIVGSGTSIAAERSDGLRWFLDERTPAGSSDASYVIIVKQEGANK